MNRTGLTPPRPSTLQLYPFMVAARLMTLLQPGLKTPTEHHPHLTEEDMPGIQRCFFETVRFLQQSDPHVLEQTWTPPGSSPNRASKTPPGHQHAPHMTQPTAPAPACTQDTRDSGRRCAMPEPAPSLSLPTGPSSKHQPPASQTPRRPRRPSPQPPTQRPPPPQPRRPAPPPHP